MADSGTGVLLIEQFATLALGMSNRAYVMEGGRVQYAGTAQELREKPEEWNKLPLEKLPLTDVKAFLDGGALKYNLRQLDLGARRKTAEWNYAVDAGDPIGLLLPDAQEMRMHAPLLVLKARVEIAEGRYADAVQAVDAPAGAGRIEQTFTLQRLTTVQALSDSLPASAHFARIKFPTPAARRQFPSRTPKARDRMHRRTW